MSKKEEKSIWKKVKELRKKGLLPLPTEKDIKTEPSALANSQYRLKQNKDEYGETMIQAFTKFTKALHEHERFCKAWEKMKSKPIS